MTEIFDGDAWASERDFLEYVAQVLRDGFIGYKNMSDEDLDEAYKRVFEWEKEYA
jgi:hypothetical protein